jgi:hypothetical protein
MMRRENVLPYVDQVADVADQAVNRMADSKGKSLLMGRNRNPMRFRIAAIIQIFFMIVYLKG